MEQQAWIEHYQFDKQPKSDIVTRLDKGGKPTKSFWKIWYRIKALFEELNKKIADGWIICDEDGTIIKGGFVIDEKELILGVREDKDVGCTVYYGWEWVEGDETLTDYKKTFGKWKLLPPTGWQKVKL